MNNANQQSALQPLEKTNKATAISSRWLTENQTAEYLNVSASLLAKNRCYAKGNTLIPYVKMSSRCIRYDRHQLDAWLDAQMQSFSEVTAQ